VIGRLRDSEGVVQPDDVVEAAKEEISPLHRAFTWSDPEAASRFRLDQARDLMRGLRTAVVVYDPVSQQDRSIPVPVFASFKPDDEAQGYRLVAEAMTIPAQKRALLAEAYADMERFRARYGALTELAEVHSAILKAVKAIGGPQLYARARKARREHDEGTSPPA
jgi:hypothetical protein